MRKRLVVLVVATLLLAASTCACSRTKKEKAGRFTVRVVCESKGVYQIFYSCYLDDEHWGMGGMADLDKKEITSKTKLERVFTKSYFDDREDISSFSMDFSPYGKGDTSEAGTTNKVFFDAEYGRECVVVITGDREQGFMAEIRQSG